MITFHSRFVIPTPGSGLCNVKQPLKYACNRLVYKGLISRQNRQIKARSFREIPS
jgi:hypothetical protein